MRTFEVRTGEIDRRSFVKAAGVGFLAALAPEKLMALDRSDAVFASAFRAPDGSYGVATITERGEIIERIALPARAHGLSYCLLTGRCVVFGRRPGTFALIFDPSGQDEPVLISTPAGRHFYGHGHFSPDGRLLYASENDFDGNRGVIGVYDAKSQFRRIAEFDAGGIGTHDMTVSDDGRLLIVANGGIETHPDFGRTKLNLDRMQPSLAILDAASGEILDAGVDPETVSGRHEAALDDDGCAGALDDVEQAAGIDRLEARASRLPRGFVEPVARHDFDFGTLREPRDEQRRQSGREPGGGALAAQGVEVQHGNRRARAR